MNKNNSGKNNPMYGVHRFGEDNPNYKHGKTHGNKCKCGKIISFNAKRCSECYYKTLKGENNPNYGNHILSEKIKGKNNPFYGKKHNEKSLKKISKASKKMWDTVEKKEQMINAQRKGMSIRPNNIESYLINLFLKYKFLFKYVGDKSYLIEGFNPDFIYKKKIVEFNGTYWHNLESRIKSDKRKLITYRKLGYSYLILTEIDLNNENKLIKKVLKFYKKE
jgi:hypothetical protein